MNDDVNQRILTELTRLRRSCNISLVFCAALVVGLAIYLSLQSGSLSTSRQRAQTQSDSWEAVRSAIDHVDYDRASAITERIIKRYPNDYYGFSYLGYIALAADRIEEAERHYARAYDLLPSEENEKMLRAVRKRIEAEKPPQTR